MGLAATTVKHILLLLNFIFSILGIVLIGFGIFILVSGAANKIDHGENVAGGLIITLGVVILVIAIFGCLAAIHESRNKLIIYLIALIVLILIQLLMTAMAAHGTKDGLSGSVQRGFDSLWEIEQKEHGALAYYEDWLNCCGVNNTADYHNIQHDIPKSCCKDHNCRIVENIYAEGCHSKFVAYLDNKMLTFSVVGWILIIAESVAVAFAWLMLRNVQNDRRRNASWM